MLPTQNKMKSLCKILALFFLLIFTFSCNTKHENKRDDVKTSIDSQITFVKTNLVDLPDSLQPRKFELVKMPKPLKVILSKGNGLADSQSNSTNFHIKNAKSQPETKSITLVQTQDGTIITDSLGNPVVFGFKGRSNFTNFTTDNGLALDAISSARKDKLGNLWFGTFGAGLCRYDGKSFENFTISQGLGNNLVYGIIEDHKGNIWVGTHGGGVSCYDGKSFKNYNKSHGLPNDKVYSIYEDKKGNIWLGTLEGGLSKFDGKSFTNYSTQNGLMCNSVRCIYEDKTGKLWLGSENGVYFFKDGTFKNYSIKNGLVNNNVNSIVEDNDGDIWIATDGGLSRFNGNSFSNFTTKQGLIGNIVNSIFKDKRGDLWFAVTGGICHYKNKQFINYSTISGLSNNSVNSIAEDNTGNLWFGTYGGGLNRYDGEAFINYTSEVGLSSCSANSFTEDKSGNIWIATLCDGVIRFDGKTSTHFTENQGLGNKAIWSVFTDKTGNVWFGSTKGGISKYDGNSIITYTTEQGLANNAILSITEDRSGKIWIGTSNGGVSCFDGKSFVNFTTSQGLASNIVYSIKEDHDGKLWFGTWGVGVSLFDGKSFININKNQGLVDNTVWSILDDKDGNLWFGIGEGLSLLEAKFKNQIISNHVNISQSVFRNFKIPDGLPDNFVTNVVQLPNGKIGVGTNLGIALFNLSADSEKLVDIEIFNSAKGYPVKDVNVGFNSMFVDSKGILWAGTGSEKTAIIRFDYNALKKNIAPPSVIIQSVKINDEDICWFNLQSKGNLKTSEDTLTNLLQESITFGRSLSAIENDSILKRFGGIQFDGISKFYPIPLNLILPYQNNHISFEFNAVETSNPHLVKYQYILEGYDKEWSPITNKSNVSFGNINEGNYTFKLKALGANGVWSNPLSYTFKVLPPWYRTLWAYLAYSLLFVLSLLVFSKWRERKLRLEKDNLEKTVKERTAELIQKNQLVEKQKEELIEKNILVESQKAIVEKEKKRSDDLLLNILPEEVAEELKNKGSAEAKQFDQVTVLFTDFKDFTLLSEKMTAKELVEEINICFRAFDKIMDKYGIEKIKTIGDSYMCAGGLPVANITHAEDVINAGLEIQNFIQNYIQERIAQDKQPFRIRIGVHTGPVVAGIVGIRKFAYDIWGDTVNTASRMESSGEAGKINVSEVTYSLVKDKFRFVHRGKIQAKGKGEMDMYFVEGRI